MSKEEKEVLQHLADAYNKFIQLNDKHPMANREFCSAIHTCQHLIAVRIAARLNPELWSER